MAIKQGWSGRYFEDFEIGDTYRHPYGRTVTQTDNTWFTLLTMNTAEPHFNEIAGSQSEFGRCLVNSALTLAITAGQSVIDTSQNGVANLGWDNIVLSHPVFAGDTLFAETLVLSKRESTSRPHAGIVTIKTRGLNQDGEEVISFVRTFMIYKRAEAPQRSTFPEPRTPLTAPEGA